MESLFFAALYILSFVKVYKHMRISYSKVGQWASLEPNLLDVLFTVCPGLNSIIALDCLFTSPYDSKHVDITQRSYRSFFRIKNK
jgi:hypothetical protein